MRIGDLTVLVSRDTGFAQKHVKLVIKSTFKIIRSSLIEGHSFSVPEFFVMKPKFQRGARYHDIKAQSFKKAESRMAPNVKFNPRFRKEMKLNLIEKAREAEANLKNDQDDNKAGNHTDK